ncbi:Uncharacterized protein FKW44_013182 [Caligus rogercresseyi]|uniref:C2H2-type domain-containing protein n=1 Tax=Caligus rogercresseyi TaxID=217165 RepID=A0A7T8HKT6_CALRO|nr:Uncharacterized protein FKW44_013182 [Caligus rogercresseyi]
MMRKRIEHLDPQINESITLASLMIVISLENGEKRFECSLCHNRYKHHSSLFRHFKSAHLEEYEERVALREEVKAVRDEAISKGQPYLRRKNSKRGLGLGRKNKENREVEPQPASSTSRPAPQALFKLQEPPAISSAEEDPEALIRALAESTNQRIVLDGTIRNITPSLLLIPIRKLPPSPPPRDRQEDEVYPLDLSLKEED